MIVLIHITHDFPVIRDKTAHVEIGAAADTGRADRSQHDGQIGPYLFLGVSQILRRVFDKAFRIDGFGISRFDGILKQSRNASGDLRVFAHQIFDARIHAVMGEDVVFPVIDDRLGACFAEIVGCAVGREFHDRLRASLDLSGTLTVRAVHNKIVQRL